MLSYFLLIPFCSLLAIGFSIYLVSSILKNSEGTDQMKAIAAAVREGAGAYLSRRHKICRFIDCKVVFL